MGRKGNGVLRIFSFAYCFLLFLIAGATFQNYTEAGEVGKVRNHACIGCHRANAAVVSAVNPFPPEVDPASVCMDCHHYEESHHPVNFIPKGGDELSSDLASFPLFGGKVKCLTCHEAHGAVGPKLLRGGPYVYRNEICFRCHDLDLNKKVNPHQMLDEEGFIREINGRAVCLFCHTTVPEQGHAANAATFKADVAFLCWRCHPPMEGPFFNGHFMVKPKKETMERMKAVEKEKGILLPLLNRDRITCSTCHNPHQAGVIQYGPAQAGADLHDRLRLPKETICSGCHSR